mmetsp:Transcript_4046/g.11859  ORF Transcript_4046/g.11859 Transcript_4046/m.11859 type:complete len:203 (-) Transcript_4046:908-1516(-)
MASAAVQSLAAARGRPSCSRTSPRLQYMRALAQPREMAPVSFSRASSRLPSSSASAACCFSAACCCSSASESSNLPGGVMAGNGGSSADTTSSPPACWPSAIGMASTLSCSAMLIQPSLGPLPVSRSKCSRSPTSSSSETVAPVERRCGVAMSSGSRTCGEDLPGPSLTTIPPLSAPPTISHRWRAARSASRFSCSILLMSA